MGKIAKSTHKKNKEILNKDLYRKLKKEKKEEEKEHNSFLEVLSDKFKLPEDVILGSPIITMIGKSEVCIENYKGIIEYNTTQVKVITKIGRIQIDGKKLEITYFTSDEMKINGIVHNISYMVEK